MKMHHRFIVVAASTFASIGSLCHAQNPQGLGVVQGQGSQVVKRMPDTIRVYLQVSAKGKTLEDALANLKKRTESIREQTPKLGGDANSVKFTPPDKSDSSQQQQMMDQLRRQMGNERVPKGLAAPTSVTVNTMFSADWPVTAEGVEKLLIDGEKLQKKILDADLSGVKADEKQATPEEREMAEEMETMMRNQYGGNTNMPKPGAPNLSFIAKLPEADRDAAVAEAFKKAHADAERLAKAAGLKLGKLQHVSSMTQAGASSAAMLAMQYRQAYDPFSRYGGGNEWRPQTETEENESSAATPAEVEFRFMVSVGYGADGN